MPLRVSCPSPVLHLFSSWGRGPVYSSPCLAWGRLPPCGQACICVLNLRAVGAAQGRAGGGASRSGCGASGVGRPPTPDRPSSGRVAPARYSVAVGAGGVGVGTRHQNPTARPLASWLCSLWGRHEGPRGGATLASVWGIRGEALSHARPLYLGRAARGPSATCCGCGGCGRGDPPPTSQPALLPARFARCGGGTRAPRGGALLAWLWGVRGWALSDARPPVLGACGLGPLRIGCRCGQCGLGDLSPTPQRPLL